MLVVDFKTRCAPASLGKQKTAEMPRELRRENVWVCEKYISTGVFNPEQ